MNIKKLEELDKKQNSKLDALKMEHSKLKDECNAKREKLPRILIEKGQSDADSLAAELNKLSMLLEAQETAINQLESKGSIYYTDKDVLEGFKDYTAEYNIQFEKLHASYLKCFDEAFSLYKKMVELRKSALTTKEDFKNRLKEKNLINTIAPLATLDIRNRFSKDASGNFLSFYGDDRGIEAIRKSGEDIGVF